MSSTPASTRPDPSPADIIVEAFGQLRARYATAPAVVELMLAGDDEANLLGGAWLEEINDLNARLASLNIDCLALYEAVGLLEVSDATCIIDGEADPREFRTNIEITPEIVQRWAPNAIRRAIAGNAEFITGLPRLVDEGRMDAETAEREVAQFTAENERLTAELATFGGAL